MNGLTDSEVLFLRQQYISIYDLYDGRGLTRSSIRNEMKAQGFEFYLGGEFKKFGHRIRTRAGHCAQCNTSRIAFMRRHGTTGDVYIASSFGEKVVKVGSAKKAESRIENLNSLHYGGADDWKLRAVARRVARCGEIELATHKALAKHRTSAQYFKDDHLQKCKELFKCSWRTAKLALEDSLQRTVC